MFIRIRALLGCCVLLLVVAGVATGATRTTAAPVIVLDTIGSFSTSSAYPASSLPNSQSSGNTTGGEYWDGPEFTLPQRTTITEVGGFVTLVDQGDAPIVVQFRPALNGAPDPARVAGTATLSDDHAPWVYRYESA